MTRLPIIFIALVLFVGVSTTGYPQGFLKKITKQVENKVDKALTGDESKDGKSDKSVSDGNADVNKNNSTSSGKKIQNTQGEGLTSTPPDVQQNIISARTAAGSKNFTEARYSVRQAIQGVELEIGYNILKSLPGTADQLPKDTTEDKVMSGGIGFAGLTIHRVYHNDAKELGVDIINDAVMYTGITMFLSNPAYAGAGNDNKMKQVKFKSYPSVIQFDQNSGYTLSVPFGQTSLFVVNGVNYKDEATFMNAAGIFDIESIKTELGEK